MNKDENELTEIRNILSPDLPRPEYTARLNEKNWLRRLKRLPKRMLRTRIDQLPPGTQTILRETIRGTDFETFLSYGEGFTLAGPTGSGKTRAAVYLALRLAAIKWGFPSYLSAVAIRSKAFSDWGAADKIIDQSSTADVLVLDDLGKGTPTGVVDDILFAILENRGNAELPTLITTNYEPLALAQRFKETETAAAALRRIQEYNTPLILSDQGTNE